MKKVISGFKGVDHPIVYSVWLMRDRVAGFLFRFRVRML